MTSPQFTWSWNISLGNVVSFTVAVVVAAGIYFKLEHNVTTHSTRLDELEAELRLDQQQLTGLADVNRRLIALEATAARNVDRLNAMDVMRAQLDAKFLRIDELMSEVRDELRTMNRRTAL